MSYRGNRAQKLRDAAENNTAVASAGSKKVTVNETVVEPATTSLQSSGSVSETEKATKASPNYN